MEKAVTKNTDSTAMLESIEAVKAMMATIKDGNVSQSIDNCMIALANDPNLKGCIGFNEIARIKYLRKAVPWNSEPEERPFQDIDGSGLRHYMQKHYGLAMRGVRMLDDAVALIAQENKYHPIRERLESLEYKGDGYIRSLLPDYLGAEDDEYNAEVMKLFMLAAIHRIYEAGCKFDYMMVIVGEKGIKKSTFCKVLALKDEWYTDSLQEMKDKDSKMILSGHWIIEDAELKLVTKGKDWDYAKLFLSKSAEDYRKPYGHEAVREKRQCIFIGTTNRSTFLGDATGDRRFIIVDVGEHKPKKDLFSDNATQDFEAAWAEALHIYHECGDKPKLVLPENMEQEARHRQELANENDEEWVAIRSYLKDKAKTCVLEIWVEALGNEGKYSTADGSRIKDLILRTGEWKRDKNSSKYYKGSQRTFSRICSKT